MSETFNCDVCDRVITWGMAQTTMNRYRKMLCFDCQETHIRETYPKKLAEITIARLKEYKQINK